MLNNFIVFGVPRCGSTYIIQLLEDYLIKKYNLIKSNEHEFFNIFKNIPNNLYIKNSIIKLHTWGTYNNIIEYNLINNISVAITRKNKIDMFVSWLIANETGQWSLHENEQKILPNKKIHLSKEKHGRDSITKYVNSIVRFEYFLKKYKLPIIRYENIFEDIKKLFPDWKLNLKIKYEEERIKKIYLDLEQYKLPTIQDENLFEDIKKLFPNWKFNWKDKDEIERIKKQIKKIYLDWEFKDRPYMLKQNDNSRYNYVNQNDINFFNEVYNKDKDKNNLDLDNTKSYSCKAPWISMYIGPNGDVSPCCTSLDIKLGNTNNSTLDDIWNSNASKKFRNEMIKNIPNYACKFCYKQEEHHPTSNSLRKFFNKTYNTPTENSSLTPQLKLKYLDIRFSNECNHACIMCESKLSNKLYEYENDFKNYSIKKNIQWSNPKQKGIIRISNETIDELKKLIDDVDHIYFAGGEPLIMKEHYALLDFLIEKKLNKKIHLRYNTNLSTLKYKNINIIEKWKLFPNLSILPSSDMNGERGTYQRWGFNWDKFKNNWLKIKNELPQTRLGMQITISALTIGYLPEFLNELEKIGCDSMDSNFVHGPLDLNPQVLPPELKKIYTNKLNRYISKTSNDQYKNLLLGAINFMNDINRNEKIWKHTIHRLNFLDEKRKTNWKSLWPEFIQYDHMLSSRT